MTDSKPEIKHVNLDELDFEARGAKIHALEHANEKLVEEHLAVIAKLQEKNQTLFSSVKVLQETVKVVSESYKIQLDHITKLRREKQTLTDSVNTLQETVELLSRQLHPQLDTL